MIKIKDIRERRSYNRKNIVPSLRKAGCNDLASKIASCAKYSSVATCIECETKYFLRTSYCQSRFCALCAKRRALAWLAKLVPLLQHYRDDGYLIFFLDLTILDEPILKDNIEHILRAWRVMTHDDKECRKKFNELNNGGIRSVEVKLGANSHIWHSHIHSIVLKKSNTCVYQYEQYKELWEKATRTAFGRKAKVGSVYISGIKDKDGGNSKVALIKGVVETFKYIAKCDWANIPPEKLTELVEQSKGKHFISSWGVLYGLNKQVEELLNSKTDEELKDYVCKVCGCSDFVVDTLLTDYINEVFDLRTGEEC